MYPRRDAPLLPPALAPFIGAERVHPRTIAAYGLPTDLRLADLDQRVWNEFPPESVTALADEVLVATRNAIPSLRGSSQLVPIDTSGVGLSTRSRNLMFRAGVLGSPWLNNAELGFLLEEQGMGPKALLEILVAGSLLEPPEGPPTGAAPAPAPEGKRSRAVMKAADTLRRKRWSGDITRLDPRLGADVRSLHEEADTAREAAELLSEMTFEPAEARSKARELKELVARAERLRRATLTDELGELLDALLPSAKPSHLRAIDLRLGLSGELPRTLGAAGENVGLTRERVRQVEQRFREAVSDARPWMPALDRTLAQVRELIPARAADVERSLVEKELLGGPLPLEALIRTARAFARDPGFDVAPALGIAHASDETLPSIDVGVLARKLTTHWGASTIDALHDALGEQTGEPIDPRAMRLMLEAVPGFEWLDDECNWFWVRGTSRNRLLNTVEKIMSVAGSITISELRDGVGRWYRMDGFRPPRDVLARLCVQSGSYRRDGELIMEGPQTPRWEDVLGTIERTMADVLFEHGPVMRRDDFERLVVDERGINRSSFYVYLGYSPILARYAPGVYGLRGARVTAAAVDAMIPTRSRRQRLLDHGWTSDGRIWIAYRLSTAAIAGGVLSVPAALKGILRGSFLLKTEHSVPIGTLVAKDGHIWGVGPFFRRWGVEEGDFVVVTVTLNEQQATVLAGTDELLLRFQSGE